MNFVRFTFLLLAWILSAGVARAASMGATYYQPGPAVTNYEVTSNLTTYTVAVAKFDPGLGHLDSVSFGLNGYIKTEFSGQNNDHTQCNGFTGRSQGTITLMRPDNTQLAIVTPLLRQDVYMGPAPVPLDWHTYDCSADLGLPVGSFLNYQFDTFVSASGADARNYNTAGDLALFTGPAGAPGTVNLKYNATGNSNQEGASNLSVIFATNDKGDFTVTYNYTRATIAGTVYLDMPAPVGQKGLRDVTVQVNSATAGAQCATTAGGAWSAPPCAFTTGDTGAYTFYVTSGTWDVTETQPWEWQDSTTTPGTAPAGGSAGTRAKGAGTVGGGQADAITGIVVPSGGGNSTGNDFHEIPGTVEGNVYLDVGAGAHYNNGAMDAEEPGLSGQTVKVQGTALASLAKGAYCWDIGSSSLKESSACTATTDSVGHYKVYGVSAGTFSITETQPVGVGDGKTSAGTGATTAGTVVKGAGTVAGSAADAVSGVVIPVNAGLQNYNFGELGSSIDGYVFLDDGSGGATANDGAKGGTEAGIGGVTVQLVAGGAGKCLDTSTSPYSLVATCSQVTGDGSGGSVLGYYKFYGLTSLGAANATYTVEEKQPAGYIDGKTRAGTGGAGAAGTPKVDGTVIAVNNWDQTTGVAIGTSVAGVGETLVNYDFAELPANIPPTVSKSFSPTGIPVKPAVGAATTSTLTVVLTNGNAAAATLITASFVDTLPDHVYFPTGAVVTVAATSTPSVGAAAGSCDGAKIGLGNTVSGSSFHGVLTVATGYVLPASGNCTITVPVMSDLGAADGASYTNTIPAGTLITDKGTYNSDVSASLKVYSGAISGRVWLDVGGNNGTYEGGTDTIFNSGVQINLQQWDGAAWQAVTNATSNTADGTYGFANLGPGTYRVAENAEPAGTTNGDTTAGTITGSGAGAASGNGAAGTASNLATTPSSIQNITLGAVAVAGANIGRVDSSPNNNFAERTAAATASLSGYVYVEADNVPGFTAGDSGIAAVTVKLSGKDSGNNVVSLTTTTDANGAYSFTGLGPSDATGYTITEIQPKAYTDSTDSIAAGNPGTVPVKPPLFTDGQSDAIAGVTLAAGQALTHYDFAEVRTGLVLKPPIISGYVYLDNNHTRNRLTANPEYRGGWTVVLTRNNGGVVTTICTVQTDNTGFYQFDNLHCPGYEVPGLPVSTGPGDTFSITFKLGDQQASTIPTSGGNLGTTTTTGQITNLTLKANEDVVEQNLPLDPSGVVYDAVTGRPVPGAVVGLYSGGVLVPAACLAGNPNPQTTAADGFYQFQLLAGPPVGCPGTGTYTLQVTAPAGYLPAPSTLIPECAGSLNVNTAGAPAVVRSLNPGAGVNYLPAALASAVPGACPAASAGLNAGNEASSQYYFRFDINFALPSANVVNDHIPLDPSSVPPIIVTKTTPMVTVARGDLVAYTITASNARQVAIPTITISDQIPPGFKYRTGSATVDGVAVEPAVSGRVLSWANQSFAVGQKKTLKMLLIVGSGVGDGTYSNCVWALSGGATISNTACAPVKIVPDPTFDCPDVIGKVFDDRNANGYQDQGEPGIPGVRLATPRGLLVTTDAQGRFHVPCPEVPNPDRGANFFMKLDDRTLPSGYRLTTENPRDVRLTRGKLVKLNFGATIHRVVRIELSDAAFVPGKTDLLPEFQGRMEPLPRQLTDKPSLIRLAYLPGADENLRRKRLDALREQLARHWQALNCCYRLVIETEGEGE